MALFNETTVLGSGGGQPFDKGACLALVEKLGAAMNSPRRLRCNLSEPGLGLHSSISTPSRRRDEARGIYANGAPKVGEQAPGQIVPVLWLTV
jgi:hypothetical protein